MKDKGPVIRGERICLRPVTLKDAKPLYVKWLNDKEVNRFLETRHKRQTIGSVRSYIEEITNRKEILFMAICLKEGGRHIGNIKIGPINTFHRFSEIGIMIGDKSEWGRGYASEAISLISRYAFDSLKLHKLTTGCYESNTGSRKAFEKAGFKVEFLQRKQYLYNGEYVDRICLTLFSRKKEGRLK